VKKKKARMKRVLCGPLEPTPAKGGDEARRIAGKRGLDMNLEERPMRKPLSGKGTGVVGKKAGKKGPSLTHKSIWGGGGGGGGGANKKEKKKTERGKKGFPLPAMGECRVGGGGGGVAQEKSSLKE